MLHSLLCSQPKSNIDLNICILNVVATLIIISSINNKRMGITPGSITKVGFLQQWLTSKQKEKKLNNMFQNYGK